jgi:NAD-dependent DNA ligase
MTTVRVEVVLPRELYLELTKRAKAKGMTVGQFLRNAAATELRLPRSSFQLRPGRPPKPAA